MDSVFWIILFPATIRYHIEKDQLTLVSARTLSSFNGGGRREKLCVCLPPLLRTRMFRCSVRDGDSISGSHTLLMMHSIQRFHYGRCEHDRHKTSLVPHLLVSWFTSFWGQVRLSQHAVNLVAVSGEFALNSMVRHCVHNRPTDHLTLWRCAALPLFPLLLHAPVAVRVRHLAVGPAPRLPHAVRH